MNNAWEINLFGVRHLSPSGAWHLRRYLDRIRPELVLIEGLSDAASLTEHWVNRQTVPPIAILAYTTQLPVRTLVYPIARYSPEFQGVVWAHENDATVDFIDLPSDIFLGLQELAYQRRNASKDSPRDASSESSSEEETTESDILEESRRFYQRIAELSDEPNYDSYWERNFEHNLVEESYRQGALVLGKELREREAISLPFLAENLVRESYMRRRIEEAIQRGVSPDKIVAVVGAFHAPVLSGEHPAMTDEELARLPRRESKLTLMPYSYFRLSHQSGYGAGNSAPAYFELMWDAINDGDLPGLANRYLSTIAHRSRANGTHRSTAEVIEGVRLARTLAAMHSGQNPTLEDLHDAAVTLIGYGELSSVAESIAHVDVGTAIGTLPAGVSRTSIQDDFDRLLIQWKLEKYRTTIKQPLNLDLRENRQAKSEGAAFLDSNRSTFLHRLRILEVLFAEPVRTQQDSATWAENWNLQWSPESEITLVESILLGETIEVAAAYKLKQKVEASQSISESASLVLDACQADMPSMMELAQKQVQFLSAESVDVVELASAAFQLFQVVRYGTVRRFDGASLIPLIRDLFVKCALSLFDAANCDNGAAVKLVEGMDLLNRVAYELHEEIDESLWKEALLKLSDSDDRNPILSGLACSILLERNWMTNESLGREVSRRLSPGIPADLGAGWFEGIAIRNRYSLIARQVLWEQLSAYIDALDEEEFRRSLVFLRRSFGAFSPNEKRNIVENLANIWGLDADSTNEALETPLSESENQALEDLNDFDFDDL